MYLAFVIGTIKEREVEGTGRRLSRSRYFACDFFCEKRFHRRVGGGAALSLVGVQYGQACYSARTVAGCRGVGGRIVARFFCNEFCVLSCLQEKWVHEYNI